ncbi:DUF3134 domain-containing protein [Gloeothece verrucosa]|uniref:DUF3134 domain-containing protein n=1 Tax=Gloeothece verrucosa (strain PCC 7822) TaxID=497965 RepID=E0UEP5_GLOV7|nr:DUF3134 domain-containing protein [Gloeothece verrucosa]ADN16613.1 conserved hypothetical protein [Gloeothece verrucosa PCC 7822]
MYNPSLQQEPRYEPAKVVPLPDEPSMIEWLTAQGRIIKRDPDEKQVSLEPQDIDLLEIEGDYYDTDDTDDDDFEIEDDDT